MERLDVVRKVRIPVVKKILLNALEEGDLRSKLLLGGIGIGKSTVVYEIAKEFAEKDGKIFVKYDDRFGRDIERGLRDPREYFVFVDLRLTECLPEDLIGVPRDLDDSVVYKQLLWAKTLQKCEGILFLDEITLVQRLDMQAVMYKLFHDRTVGFTELNERTLVVGAGNTPEDVNIATELPSAVIDRVDVFECEAPTIDEWRMWMDENYKEWDKRVYAFLKRYPQYFIQKPEDTQTLRKFATPRGWTNLAITLSKYDEDILPIIITAKVGYEAGAMFETFINVKVPELEEVIKRPEMLASLKIDAKYLLVTQLAMEMQEMAEYNALRYGDVIRYMYKKDREMLSLLVSMLDVKTFMRLATSIKELGEYVKELSRND